MQKTVSFFNDCKNYILKLLSCVKLTANFLVGIIVLVACSICFFKTSNYLEGILAFATNVRVSNKKIEYTIADLIKVYPVFNGNNYIVAESKNVQDVDKEEIISSDTSLFDASAVDVMSNAITITKPNYTKKSTSNYDRIDIYGVTIYDYSSKKIDFEELFERNVDLTKKSDPILMYCSHTSESYSNSDNFKFKYTGNYRTKDANYNMLSVANII